MKKYKYLSITVGKSKRYLCVMDSTPLEFSSDTIDAKEVYSHGSFFDADAPLKEILCGMNLGLNQYIDGYVELLDFCASRDSISPRYYYNTLVSAFVRSSYSEDEMEAIICNQLDDPTNEEHAKEYKEMQEHRAYCKSIAKEIIEKAEKYGSKD